MTVRFKSKKTRQIGFVWKCSGCKLWTSTNRLHLLDQDKDERYKCPVCKGVMHVIYHTPEEWLQQDKLRGVWLFPDSPQFEDYRMRLRIQGRLKN